MKQLLCTALLFTTAALSHAGDYLTNTNQHVSFLRNPARGASTEIDALYSNPAGIAFLSPGWHFSLNGQSAYQRRIIGSTFAPFTGNANGNTSATGYKEFKGEASAPFIPSVFAAYKRDKWTFGGSFALTGGGGKATFNAGLPSFEAPVSMLPLALQQVAGQIKQPQYAADRYAYDTYMEGRQYIFGLSLGAAYHIQPNLSVYLGGRVNYVSNHYEGYLRNISANLGKGDVLQPLTPFLTAAAKQAQEAATALGTAGQKEQAAQMTMMATMAGKYAQATSDKELDVDQSGWGITPIIGIDYQIGEFNFGLKYEFKTNLNIQNQTKINTTGIASFEGGINTPHDIPAMLSLGASYKALHNLRISAGYHHFFDKAAGMSGGRQNHLTRGTNEYLLGAEYDITPTITISAGAQRTSYGLSDDFQQDLSFYCSSYSVGMGAAFKLSKRMKFNIAYFFTNYDDYTKKSANYYGTSIPGTDVYKRTNQVLGAGIDIAL